MFEPDSSASPDSHFIARHFAGLSRDFDHLLFDRPSRSADCSGARVKLYVAVPDLSSLARVQKIKLDLDSNGDAAFTICVLNRFDASIPLHTEILAWYRDNFPQLVLLRESPLVSEALAEGTTVVDWVPDSPIAADYLNLLTTVRNAFSTQSERLSLCS
jgi:MinD-like ATPase involved in chromosome partitioning or flagellar assembly